MTNATVAGNSAESGGGICTYGGSTTLRNSIIAKNNASYGDADVYGNYSGQNNIVGVDPGFVYAPQFDADGKPINVDAWNLRLKKTSEAIDAGNNAYVVGEYDCDGNARVHSGKKGTSEPTVDLGAYEFEFVDPGSKTFTVDSLGGGDGSDVDGARTLRWAISQASLPEWEDGDVLITFANDLNGGSYLGATGELSIRRSLRIDASNLSDGITISAASGANEAYGTHRVFNINGSGADTTKVEMIGVTIKDGWNDETGGGICVTNANLTLTNSRVKNNCVECDYYAQGGGIYADASNLTLNGCAIMDNSAIGEYYPEGGGIYATNGSTVTTANSEFSRNFVDGGYGGGISLSMSTANLISTLVKGNSAELGGGIYAGASLPLYGTPEYSTVELTNATVAGNSAYVGGGIYAFNDSQTTLKNSIIAKNYVDGEGDANIYNGWTGETQYNIVGDDPAFVYAPVDADGKPTNVDAWNLRLTKTSEAIDAGNNDDVVGKYDCDDSFRIRQGKLESTVATVDIGAYEFVLQDDSGDSVYPLVVTTNADKNVPEEKLSLREAVKHSVDGDRIIFDVTDKMIELNGAEIAINKKLTINADGITINANNHSRIFNVAPNKTVAIMNGTFINGKSGSTEAPENGGAIYNAGMLTLNGAKFQANAATKNGGAVFNDEGAILNVDGGEYLANSAVNGGVIANYGTTNILGKTETTIVNNSANKFGGAYFGVGSLVVGSDGSAITTFSNNAAGYRWDSEEIVEEYAGGKGGAIYNDVWRRNDEDLIGTVEITGDVLFDSNKATERGGAIQTYSKLTIAPDEGESVEFSSNTALKYGGALDVGTGGEATLGGEGDLKFDSNKALGVDEQLVGFGGAIFSVGNLTFEKDGNYLFTGNEAAKSGGAIDASRGKLTLTGEFEFTLNKANGSFDEEADEREAPEKKTGVGGGILTAAQTLVQTSDGSKASFKWGEGENGNTAGYGSCVAIDTNISNLGYDLFGLENDERYATFTVFRTSVSKTTALLPTTFAPQAKLAAITIRNVTTTFGMNGVTPEQLGLGVGTTNALVSYVDASGETSAIYSLILTVENDASLYVVETAIANDCGVKFDFNLTKEDGRAVSVWEISWGDGTTSRFERLSNSLTTAHYYAQDGFFNVSLKATYLDGTCATFESFATRKIGDDAKFEAVEEVFATSDDLFDEIELEPFLH